MKCPLIPRSVYDDLRTQYDALLEKYHALKVHGAVAPSRPATAIPSAPSPEERARREAEHAYTEAVVRDFVGQGMTEADARQIAQALRRSALDLSPVPMDG